MIKGLRNIKTMSTISRQIALNNISNKAELSSCQPKINSTLPVRGMQTGQAKLKKIGLNLTQAELAITNKTISARNRASNLRNNKGYSGNACFQMVKKHVRKGSPKNKSFKAELSSCKTWVFTRKPKFVRFQKSLHVERIEEPHVDIFENSITKRDKTNTITVIAQIPVIRRRDIKVDIKGDILILDVETQHLTSVQGSSKLRYYKEVVLPFKVKPLYTNCTFKNGILQVDLEGMNQENTRSP